MLPKLTVPICTQAEFIEAVRTVELCASSEKVYGVTRPFFAPGGKYGTCWWSLDYALAVDGYKWIDPRCETDFLYNLQAMQDADGRILLYGIDNFDHVPIVTVPVSSLPKYFETACNAFFRTRDRALQTAVYETLARNLEWWVRERLDKRTGLFSALFEETFTPNTDFPAGEYCPVDTNMQLACGCGAVARMAEYLGRQEAAARFEALRGQTLAAVERYLWSEEGKAYFPYLPSQKSHYGVLMATTFNAMLFRNAAPERRAALLEKLTDPALFGWGRHALTTYARTEPGFSVVRGEYIGNPCWQGSVWTLTNRPVIHALAACGEREYSAELACATVREFKNSYTEFHDPDTGEGFGVADYAWTAAQCIAILVEDLFGISVDLPANEIRIAPNLPSAYADALWSIEDLPLPDGAVLSVRMENGRVSCRSDSGMKLLF